MAKGKLDLYAIGQGGVNVVKNPIVLDRDEALLLQNIIYPSLSGEGGIQKRGGIARRHAAALNSGGDIVSIEDVPLPNPFNTASLPTKYLYTADQTEQWYRSSDGTTWTPITPPNFPGLFDSAPCPILGIPPVQPIAGLMLYVEGGGSVDTFLVWDGTSERAVIVVPPAVSGVGAAYSAGGSGYHNGNFYFGSNNPPAGRVYKFDLITGQLTMIVGVIGTNYTPFAIVSFIGQLFVAASDDGASPVSFIYRCDPDTATAWVTDSAALSGVPTSMVNFQGNLYIVTGSDNAAEPMNIYKRTPSGVYSTVFTDATPWNVTRGGPLMEFNDTLFAYVAGNIVKSTNGTAWSVDRDVFTTDGIAGAPGRPVIFNGALYWPFKESGGGNNGKILKRTTGGVWSTVLTGHLHGALTVFEAA